VSPLASIAAVETSKHRLSRDLGSLSIFAFFNNIRQLQSFPQVGLCCEEIAKVLEPDLGGPHPAELKSKNLTHVRQRLNFAA
jgi:hypothetical protein